MNPVRKRVSQKEKEIVRSFVRSLKADRETAVSPEDAADRIVNRALRSAFSKFKLQNA
jgi:hypothetical protein